MAKFFRKKTQTVFKRQNALLLIFTLLQLSFKNTNCHLLQQTTLLEYMMKQWEYPQNNSYVNNCLSNKFKNFFIENEGLFPEFYSAT